MVIGLEIISIKGPSSWQVRSALTLGKIRTPQYYFTYSYESGKRFSVLYLVSAVQRRKQWKSVRKIARLTSSAFTITR
jgi:hypothetical protein